MEIRGRIEEFRPYIPLIQGLRNPGMRNRHWEMLSKEININIKPKANLTFSRCLEMKLLDHIDSIAKIAEIAGKEFSIENVRRTSNEAFFSVSVHAPKLSLDESSSYDSSILSRALKFTLSVTEIPNKAQVS